MHPTTTRKAWRVSTPPLPPTHLQGAGRRKAKHQETGGMDQQMLGERDQHLAWRKEGVQQAKERQSCSASSRNAKHGFAGSRRVHLIRLSVEQALCRILFNLSQNNTVF